MTRIPTGYLARIGAKGGAAGRGPVKRRGTAEYYAGLSHKRWGTKPKPKPKVIPPSPLAQRKDRWRP